MFYTQEASPRPDTHPPQFSAEDWLLIDEALNRIARALRKIEREQRQQASDTAENHPPDRQ